MTMTGMIMTKQTMRSLIVISIDDNDRDTNDKVEAENNVGDIFQRAPPRRRLHQRGAGESWLFMNQDPAQPVR